MIDDVVAIARVFSFLSLLTLGGGMAAYPELSRLVVNVHQWLTMPQLDQLYGVGQAGPGPNMAIVSIGAFVAGVPGGIIAFIAFLGPPAVLAFVVGRLWTRVRGRPWFVAIQRGLAPVSIGLLLAGCLTFARGSVNGWLSAAITAGVFVAVLRTSINPALLVLAGGIVGIIAFVVA